MSIKVTGLLILGAGGHGSVVADAAAGQGCFATIGFIDPDRPAGSLWRGFPVVGTDADLGRFSTAEWNVVVALGNNERRSRLQADTSALGYGIATVIHRSAVISREVGIGAGTVVLAGAVVQVGAELGAGVIVNDRACVEHDCRVGAFSHIAPGATLGGNVKVGAGCLIGTGAAVCPGIEIGDNVVVGAGAVVVAPLLRPGVYVGVPARPLETRLEKIHGPGVRDR